MRKNEKPIMFDIFKSACALEYLAQQVYDEVAVIYDLLDKLNINCDTLEDFEREARKARERENTFEHLERCF